MRLRLPPRLASWNAVGDPAPVRLAAALADAEELLTPMIDRLNGPLALQLDVGLTATVPLLAHHDLDNYLFPLAVHLMKRPDMAIVSVWGTKRHGATSTVRVAPAAVTSERLAADFVGAVRTTASASTTVFKQQISDQLSCASELPPGPVALELAFEVGARRNWLNLWKPTIDALDRLLGRTFATRSWHPRDGRITELGLHCSADHTLGNDVVVHIAARSLG